jgi:hypothetical protein
MQEMSRQKCVEILNRERFLGETYLYSLLNHDLFLAPKISQIFALLLTIEDYRKYHSWGIRETTTSDRIFPWGLFAEGLNKCCEIKKAGTKWG